jgi:hypothetical protein
MSQSGERRMSRLNGWQRIGIVLSVLWFLGGAFWGNEIAIRDGGSWPTLQLKWCLSRPNADYSECNATFEKDYEKGIAGHWSAGLLVGLVPIPIAWLLVWAVVAIVRWVRRGFRGEGAC